MKSWIYILLYALGGAAVGLLYYHFFGCTTGCPITSNPWSTMGYFTLVGLLVGPLMLPNPKKDK